MEFAAGRRKGAPAVAGPRTRLFGAHRLALALLLCTAAGWSSGGIRPHAAHAESASALFEQGVAALKEQRYRDAATALDASYRLEQLPKTMYHLGLAYEGLGYPDKAVEALGAFASFADPKAEQASIAAARQRITDIKASVAQFAVSLQPQEATIKLDGATVKPNKGELWVLPGSHRISIAAPDFEPFEQTIEVKPGRFELDIHLRPITDPPEVRATKLLDEGDRRRDVGDFHGAVQKYDAAQAILPTPRGAGSAGLAKEQIGALAEAEAGVLEALVSRRDPWVRKHRRDLRKAKARLAPQLATLVITGDRDFDGATVSIGDREVGRLPLPSNGETRTITGSLLVKATLEGYEDFVYELSMRPRSRRQITVSMRKAPPKVVPVPVPVPVAAPAVVAPAPAAVAAAAPALTEAPAEEGPQSEAEGAYVEAARTADIEIEVERYEPEDTETDGEPATGMEMAVSVGYQFSWKAPAKSSGGLSTHLFSLGLRPIWPLSFGIQLFNASVDAWNEGTRAVVSLNPGFYLRGHTQQHRKALAVDVWGGLGLQPLAMGLAVYKENSADVGNVDASMLGGVDTNDVVGQVAKNQLGVSYGVTVQSVNVPLELGVAFYLTKGLALELATAFTFWIPTQECVWDQNDHVCYDSDIKAQKSFYIGAGLSFLP